MAQAINGNVVKVHYTGKLEDGTIFDTSFNRDPLQFQVGEGRLIPGFEQAVIGMKPGDEKTTQIPANLGFGARLPGKVYVIDRSKFPADVHVGQQYQIGSGDYGSGVATVIDVSKETVTLDANHPLAGQNLIFDIQLLEVL